MSKKKAAIIGVLALMIISKALGFLKEVIIAFYFGATEIADLIYISIQIPNVIYSVFGGALLTAIVPFFIKLKERDGEVSANTFTTNLFLFVSFFTLSITAVLFFFSSIIMDWIAPGITGSNKELLDTLFRITIFSIPAYCLIMVINGMLNSYKKFGNLELVQIIANFTAISFVILLYGRMDVYSFPVGVVAGYIIGLLFLILYASKFVTLKAGKFNLIQGNNLKSFAVMLVPVILTLSLNQFYLIFEKIVGSFLSYGSIASLNYANKIMQLPVGIFATAISVVYYPELTEKAISKEKKLFQKDIYDAVALITIVSLPCVVLLNSYSEPVVSLLFGYGEFDARSIHLTSSALHYYSIGVWFICISTLITKVFYVIDDMKTPLKIMAVSISACVITSLGFVQILQHKALALGLSTLFVVNTTLLLYMLSIKTEYEIKILSLIGRIAPILLCNVILYVCSLFINIPADLSKTGIIAFLFVISLMFGMGYLVLLYFFKEKLTVSMLHSFKRKRV